jgi:hypothetical protein
MGFYTPAITGTQLHCDHILQLVITESNQSSNTSYSTVDSDDEKFMLISEAAHDLCITDHKDFQKHRTYNYTCILAISILVMSTYPVVGEIMSSRTQYINDKI